MVSHRFSSNRVAKESPYPFGHPGLAGEPAGLNPAQIWPSLARSGRFYFFPLCSIYLLIKCYDLNQFKNVIGLRKI
jgi:hypothetical protein